MIALKQIVLDCIADMRQKSLYDREAEIILSNTELFAYAEGRGYQVNPAELFNVADTLDIQNEGWEGFHHRVIEPLRMKQKFFSASELKRLSSIVYLGQMYPSIYEPMNIIINRE